MAARRKITTESTEVEAPIEDAPELDQEAIDAIAAAADEDLPEPPEQEFVSVKLGNVDRSFLKGHELSVADLLDALDGFTERVFTTKTHILTRRDAAGIPTHFHSGDEILALNDGDTFTADLRLLG